MGGAYGRVLLGSAELPAICGRQGFLFLLVKENIRLGTSKEYDLILYLLPWKQDENRPNHLPTGNNRLEKSDDKVDENFNLICLNKIRSRWFEKTA